MKNFFLNIIAATLLTVTMLSAQSFDLMNVNQSQKVAMSSYYKVMQHGVEQYSQNNVSHPFSVLKGDTLFVGKQSNTTPVNEQSAIPTISALQQNFPNPFNNSTVIRYTVEQQSDVTIKVFDISGREVVTLVNESKQPGMFSVGFANNNIASGTYLYRMISKNSEGKSVVETKKMTVMK